MRQKAIVHTPVGFVNLQEVTKVFIGASAMMSNGAVLSRVGTVSFSVRPVRSGLIARLPRGVRAVMTSISLGATLTSRGVFRCYLTPSLSRLYHPMMQAVVAMMARSHNLPIMFCCETYKVRLQMLMHAFSCNVLVCRQSTAVVF